MNRRTTIKSLIGLAVVGVSSVSVFKWIGNNKPIDFKLLHQKKQLIAELAEVIIPRTDTPGAKDAKVEDFILRVLENCAKPRVQNLFFKGLIDLEEYTFDNYKHDFFACSKAEKISIMKHFEKNAEFHFTIFNKINNKLIGQPFFVELRNLTVEGYCISKIGATQGLAYDYVPVKYEACIPLTPNQRSWATK